MLREIHLQSIADSGFAVVHDLLPPHVLSGIIDEFEREKMAHGLKKAGIGKSADFQINSSERGDFIRWIDREQALPNTQLLLSTLEEIQLDLNRNFYLGIRDFETHYTEYPEGTHYKRHSDKHKNGSPRVVSFVYYLNRNWNEVNGGKLRIYHEDDSHTDIEPTAGTLALFLSEKEHEVLPTNQTRRSITGWMLNEKIL